MPIYRYVHGRHVKFSERYVTNIPASEVTRIIGCNIITVSHYILLQGVNNNKGSTGVIVIRSSLVFIVVQIRTGTVLASRLTGARWITGWIRIRRSGRSIPVATFRGSQNARTSPCWSRTICQPTTNFGAASRFIRSHCFRARQWIPISLKRRLQQLNRLYPSHKNTEC